MGRIRTLRRDVAVGARGHEPHGRLNLAGARRHAGHMDRPCEGRNRALHVPILGEQRFDLDARSGLERFFVLALDSTCGRFVPIPGLGAERRLGEHVRRMAARRSDDGRGSSTARSHECHAGARLSPDRRHARKCESDGRRRDGPGTRTSCGSTTDSTWTLAQDWASSPTLTWIPTSSGTYSFQVWVRNNGSAGLWDAWAPVGPFTTAADR